MDAIQSIALALGFSTLGLIGVLIKLRKNNMAYKAQGRAEGEAIAEERCLKERKLLQSAHKQQIKHYKEYIEKIDKPDRMSDIRGLPNSND